MCRDNGSWMLYNATMNDIVYSVLLSRSLYLCRSSQCAVLFLIFCPIFDTLQNKNDARYDNNRVTQNGLSIEIRTAPLIPETNTKSMKLISKEQYIDRVYTIRIWYWLANRVKYSGQWIDWNNEIGLTFV